MSIKKMAGIAAARTKPKVVFLFSDTTINPGGLMRCCIASIHEYVSTRLDLQAPDELVISCLYETDKDSQNIILEKGVWRWNHDVA